MLGSRTPNFCDFASEFDELTTTGHPQRNTDGDELLGLTMLAKPTSTGQNPALVVVGLDQIGESSMAC
jgi:hypothetical protein